MLRGIAGLGIRGVFVQLMTGLLDRKLESGAFARLAVSLEVEAVGQEVL